jgi:hypothetical protein
MTKWNLDEELEKQYPLALHHFFGGGGYCVTVDLTDHSETTQLKW